MCVPKLPQSKACRYMVLERTARLVNTSLQYAHRPTCGLCPLAVLCCAMHPHAPAWIADHITPYQLGLRITSRQCWCAISSYPCQSLDRDWPHIDGNELPLAPGTHLRARLALMMGSLLGGQMSTLRLLGINAPAWNAAQKSQHVLQCGSVKL